MVDWARTRAWGDGGYYGRLFLNVRGREPEGTVAPEEAEALKAELTAKLDALTDENGRPIGTKVFRPEAIYAQCRNVPPDLIVYFGDLHWRSVGSVGHSSVWTHDNDTGPDDANHSQHGLFIMAEARDVGADAAVRGNQAVNRNRREGLSLYDVAPTVLHALGITPPPGMGRSAVPAPTAAPADSPYSEEEEAELARRLEDLGYL
jgi:predicted AlkP superfamily phosphohydrolase/phosphomutase